MLDDPQTRRPRARPGRPKRRRTRTRAPKILLFEKRLLVSRASPPAELLPR